MIRSIFRRSFVGALALFVALSAVAEEVMEEIIVTAQKREQSVMDVPMAITAVTAEELENMGATSIAEIQSTIPGFAVGKLGASETFQLRGISPPGSNLPTVGRYVDEMSINTEFVAYGADFPLIDVSQVEVLKGPQGTLYGQGSIGGTVIYKTMSPTLDGEIDGTFEISGRNVTDGNSGYRVALAGDVISTENFGLRLMVFQEEGPGWVDSLQQGSDYNERSKTVFRAKALWNITDNLSAEFMYQHYENDQDGLEYSAIDGGPSALILSEKVEDEYDMFNLVLSWDIGGVSITSSTGLIERDYISPFDLPGLKPVVELFFPGITDLAPLFGNPQTVATPITAIPYNLYNSYETFSQELRANGSFGERFYWTLGAYYSDSDLFAPTATEWFPDPNTFPLQALTGNLGAATKGKAIFAEGTYAFSDKWELTAGIRSYEDDRETDYVTALFGNPSSLQKKIDNDSTAARVVLKYNFNDNVMAYLSGAEGFRSGGTQFVATALLGIPEVFDPEELITYELGAKGTIMDGRFIFETALYRTDYEDIIVYTPNPFGIQAFLNGGEVEVDGFEFGGQFFATEDLFFKVTYGNTDSSYQQDTLTHRKGEPMDYVPETTYSLAVDYRFNWSDSIGGHFRVDYFYRDGTESYLRGFGYADVEIQTEDFKSLNVRIGADFNDWSVYLFGENLSDKDAALGVPAATLTEYLYQQPRTVGITVRTSF